MKITYLNGNRFGRAIKAASLWVLQKQQYLNAINVYPVPDSDTGTNMAFTMRSIAESINSSENKSIASISKTVAESALNNARGNSVAILAQFFHGLSEGLKGKVNITTQNFSDAVRQAVDRSYEALSSPKEGTILTVIKEWGENIKEISRKTHDFNEMIQSSLQAARKSLNETPKKLKLLSKSNVVDAGGLGFVYMLEGITDFIKNGRIKEINNSNFVNTDSDIQMADVEFSVDQITFRYCTEFYLIGRDIPLKYLRQHLQHFGDSLIVAGSEQKARIHIHTDEPRTVFDFVNHYGEIMDQKVDDMHQQHIDSHDKSNTKTIALVTDSSCDLPDHLMRAYNIHHVPLRLYLDDTEYLDKVTIQPKEFYSRLIHAKTFPRTSQPTPNDFLRVYQHLAKKYDDIISIHLSGGLSGTYQSALTAAEQVSGSNVHVFDSKCLSVSLGLIVQAISEAIEDNVKIEVLLNTIKKWTNRHKLFVSVDTLEYLVKGGRVSKGKGFLANVLHKTPILSLNEEGKAEKIATAKRGRSSQQKVLSYALKEAEKMKEPRFAIVHVHAPETSDWYLQQLQSKYKHQDIWIMPVAPVLGAHAGPGTAAIAILDQYI